MKSLVGTLRKLPGIGLFILLMTAISCTIVYFDQPQPVNSRNLRRVPKAFHGQWVQASSADTSIITIDGNSFRTSSVYHNMMHISSFENSKVYRLRDGLVYNLEENKTRGYPFRIMNDTVCFTEYSGEVITLSDSAMLRKGNGALVLNMRSGLGWEVILLRKGKGGDLLVDYPLTGELTSKESGYPVSVLDSSRQDTIVLQARLKSRDIRHLIRQEGTGTIWVLSPDGTFGDAIK